MQTPPDSTCGGAEAPDASSPRQPGRRRSATVDGDGDPARTPWTTWRAVLVIAAVAVALRFWRLSWGLSGQFGFADELAMFNRYASAFTPLGWDSFAQRSPLYPTFYGYLVGASAVALKGAGLLAGPLEPAHPAAFLAGRFVSAAMGVLTVALVGVTAARMYAREVGLAAAALMAVTPFHAMYGHVASTDLTLTACVALTLLCGHRAASGGRTLDAAATGFAAGLAFASKYTGLAMLIVGAWVAVERWLRERSLRRAVVTALVVGAGFLAAVALACPPCVLSPGTMLAGMRTLYVQTSQLAEGLSNNYLTPTLGWHGRPYLFHLVAVLPFSLGWPLYAAALWGCVVALRRRLPGDRVLLVFTAVFFLSMASSRVVFPRYLLPLLPGLVVLAARGLFALRRPALRRAVFAAVWAYSLALSASQIARFSLDQQAQVAQWIADASGGAAGVRVGFPYIALDYFRLTRPLREKGLQPAPLRDGQWFADPPEYLVVPEWFEISVARDRPESPEARDLERLRRGDLGYRPAARWHSSYLGSGLYTVLDPAYAVDLWQGELGFTVWVREPAAAAPDAASAPGAW